MTSPATQLCRLYKPCTNKASTTGVVFHVIVFQYELHDVPCFATMLLHDISLVKSARLLGRHINCSLREPPLEGCNEDLVLIGMRGEDDVLHRSVQLLQQVNTFPANANIPSLHATMHTWMLWPLSVFIWRHAGHMITNENINPCLIYDHRRFSRRQSRAYSGQI